jgi:hypothetical protein
MEIFNMKKIALTIVCLPFFALAQTAPTELPAESNKKMIEGVNYGGFQSLGTQNCNFVTNDLYSCNETNFNGQILSTQLIQFSSSQELCNNLRNDALHSLSTGFGVATVAASVRQNYIINNCQAYPDLISPITITPQPIKQMTCRLSLEGIDGAYGNTGDITVPISAQGMRGEIYASMFKEKSAWNFKVVTSKRSNRYVTVNYIFSKGNSVTGDQLTLRATIKNGPVAQVSGFAGNEVGLDINNAGDVVRAEISCVVADVTNSGEQNTSSDYKCMTSGTDSLIQSPLISPIALLTNTFLGFTQINALSNVALYPAGEFAIGKGSATFKATRNGSAKSSMSIVGRTNLSTPSSFKIQNLSKTVDVRCK